MSIELWRERVSRAAVALSRFGFTRLLNLSRAVLLDSMAYLSSNLSQRKLIEQEEWDYLIVLDGCSYEYFERLNRIPGKLSCVISPATGTGMWAMRTWTRHYDAVYISANPHINSSGYAPVPNSGYMRIFDPSNFRRIIDVWNNKLWLMPEKVNSYTISNMYPHMIIHYLQPHAPFIGDPKLPLGGPESVRNWLAKNNLGVEYYRRGYESNLEIVLKAIKSLLPYLDGKVVITADHGYWDGSSGKFCHEGYGSYLQRVPWLEVFEEGRKKYDLSEAYEEEVKTNEMPISREKEEIRSRLRSLGYL